MAYRVLDVTLQSAKDLKNVNFMSRMEVYAVATISGDPTTRQCTPPDPYGGRHPTWNTTLRFAVPPTASAGASGCLHVVLRTERSRGDRDIGEVIVPLSEILDGAGVAGYDLGPRAPQFAAYQVRKVHRAETRGVLYLAYRLGAVVAPQPRSLAPPHRFATRSNSADEPVVAYPVTTRPYNGPHSYEYDYMLVPALMPPTTRASGHTSMGPASPHATGLGHRALSPPAYGEHTAALQPPLPKAYRHLSMPPPPAPIKTSGSGHMAMPATPTKTAGYTAASPWTTETTNGHSDFRTTTGLSAGPVGGMTAGDMMSDAAAYNAGYRAGMAGEWGRAVY